MQHVGRALPIKMHSLVHVDLAAAERKAGREVGIEGGHPQKRMIEESRGLHPSVLRLGRCQHAYAWGFDHFERVMPGDFIFGDNGVQLIPAHLVHEVRLQVEETFEKENAERE